MYIEIVYFFLKKTFINHKWMGMVVHVFNPAPVGPVMGLGRGRWVSVWSRAAWSTE